MADTQKGPAVPDEDTLWRVIVPAAAAVWFPGGTPSSAAFSFPVFSTDIARLSSTQETLARWPAGSGLLAFGCGMARGLGYDARHEPEHGNPAHANVYCDLPTNERKRAARKLAAACSVAVAPSTAD